MFRALVALIVVASRVSYLLLRCAPPHGFFSACLCVFIHSQFPPRSECTRRYILARRRQANMCVSHLSPAARNRQENLGCLLHKRCLLLQRKHQISVAPCLRCERTKFPTSHTKSRQSRVRVLFHAFQAQGNPAKICCGHVAIPIRQREYRISPLADSMCLPPGADHGQPGRLLPDYRPPGSWPDGSLQGRYSGRATCQSELRFLLSAGRRSAHFRMASSVGQRDWRHGVRRYSTFGGTWAYAVRTTIPSAAKLR